MVSRIAFWLLLHLADAPDISGEPWRLCDPDESVRTGGILAGSTENFKNQGCP